MASTAVTPDQYAPVIAVTDRVGEGSTNGAQVFASALLLQLAQWFDLTIVAAHADDAPPCLANRLLRAASGTDDPHLACAVVSKTLLDSTSLIYNLGGTSFSCALSAALHKRRPAVPLVNHFQVLLDACARYEGWDPARATELASDQRELAARAERNLFPSFSELSTAASAWELTEAQNYVIPNAFVGADVGECPSPHRAPFTFLAAGRFGDYSKGADLLYRAFADLHRQHPSVRLEIASEDRRFLDLLKPVSPGSWTLLGWLSRAELLRRMRAADVVVVPSRYEPFGLIAIEAMAMGTPVVAMAVGGLPEIVCHEVTGWLSPPEEGSLGLRIAMEAALGDRPRTVAMGQEGQRVVAREFSLDRVGQAVRSHLQNARCRTGRTSIEAYLSGLSAFLVDSDSTLT